MNLRGFFSWSLVFVIVILVLGLLLAPGYVFLHDASINIVEKFSLSKANAERILFLFTKESEYFVIDASTKSYLESLYGVDPSDVMSAIEFSGPLDDVIVYFDHNGRAVLVENN